MNTDERLYNKITADKNSYLCKSASICGKISYSAPRRRCGSSIEIFEFDVVSP